MAAHEVVLLRTNSDLARVAAAARRLVGATPAMTVSTLEQADRFISSSLTPVDLGG